MDADPVQLALSREQIECVIAAAIQYEVPANALLAVAEQEKGKPNQWVTNSNGTHDVGVMQFNTNYLRQLERYGIRAEHAASRDCYPYMLASWRIKNHLVRDTGSFWVKIANYHSRTPLYNQRYASSIAEKGKRWGQWLEQHYPTRVMSAADASQAPAARREASATSAATAIEKSDSPKIQRTEER